MVLAHTVGGAGGVEIELGIIGLGLLAAAFFFRPSQVGNARTAVVCLVLGIAAVVGAFAVPRLNQTATTSAKVTIAEPRDGAEVEAGKVPVLVALDGGELATNPSDTKGAHIHLFVDDKLVNMPYSLDLAVRLDPGEHEVRVEYVDLQHLSFDPPVVDSIEVMAR